MQRINHCDQNHEPLLKYKFYKVNCFLETKIIACCALCKQEVEELEPTGELLRYANQTEENKINR